MGQGSVPEWVSPKKAATAIRLCIQESIIATGDFVAEDELVTERLPTCHYERQKASSTGLQLKPMNFKDG